MKICAAQTRPVTGNIGKNISRHLDFIGKAASYGAEFILFPELSLTGYEPSLGQKLAVHSGDSRFDIFQQICDSKNITAGVGVPVRQNGGTSISLIFFQPDQPRRVCSKKYLHADEEAFFVPAQNFASFQIAQTRIAPAICYEISIAEHEDHAFGDGAQIYAASVAKSEGGIGTALNRLSDIARKHSVPVLMANSVGPADGKDCAGKTSVWHSGGSLAGQMDGSREGILLFETETGEIIEESV